MSSIRVRAVRLVPANDEPGRRTEPVPETEPIEAGAIPVELRSNHGQTSPPASLPIRFCFQPNARQPSQTNVYCGMPESRRIAVAGACRGQLDGTRLEWKLQPDGELEVRIGPARTEETKKTTSGAAAPAQDTAQTAKEDKKSEAPATAGSASGTPTKSPGNVAEAGKSDAPAATSSASGTPTKPSKENVAEAESKASRMWSFKTPPRAPVSFEVTIGSKTSVARGPSSVAVLDEPPAQPAAVRSPSVQRSLPVVIVTHSSAENLPEEHSEEQELVMPCPHCVEELANRIADSGSCRLHVVTRSASVHEIRASFSRTESLTESLD